MAKTHTRPLLREKFDPARDFIVNRSLKCGGRDFVRGSLFDKTIVSTRRLRQLYDRRDVNMLAAAEKPRTVTPPKFSFLPVEAVADWLRQHGIVPRFGATKESLVDRAEREWASRHGTGNEQVSQ